MSGYELMTLLQSCTEDELALPVIADNGTRCTLVDAVMVATNGATKREQPNDGTKSRLVRLVLASESVAARTIGYRVSLQLTDNPNPDNLPPSEGG